MHRREISCGARVTVAATILVEVLLAGTGGALVALGGADRSLSQSCSLASWAPAAKGREAPEHTPMPRIPDHFPWDDARFGKA